MPLVEKLTGLAIYPYSPLSKCIICKPFFLLETNHFRFVIEMHFCSEKLEHLWLFGFQPITKTSWSFGNIQIRWVLGLYSIHHNTIIFLLQFKSPTIVMVDITMNGWSFCKLASCQMEHEARLIDGFVIACYPRLKRNRTGRTYSTDFLFPEFDLLWISVPDCEISMIWLASFCQAICSIRRGDIYLPKLQLFCFRVMAEVIILII